MIVLIAEHLILAKAMIIRIRICDDAIEFSQSRPRQSVFHRSAWGQPIRFSHPTSAKIQEENGEQAIIIRQCPRHLESAKPSTILGSPPFPRAEFDNKHLLTEISAMDYTPVERDGPDSFRYFIDATASVLHSCSPESMNTQAYSQPLASGYTRLIRSRNEASSPACVDSLILSGL